MNDYMEHAAQSLSETFARVIPWIRRVVGAWAGKARELWGRPGGLSKGFAVVWVAGGLVIMVYAAYIAFFLAAAVIVIAFIAAVCAAGKGNRL